MSNHQASSPLGPSQRQLRVGEQIRHSIAETLQRGKFHDMALVDGAHTVTVTEVRPSPDLKYATAFVMSLGGHEMDDILPALNAENNLFQRDLGKKLQMKFTPKIRFVKDESFDTAARIDSICVTCRRHLPLKSHKFLMPPKPKTILHGWVNLNKPAGVTSNEALGSVKRALGFPKIGHAGTLDPLACGILPLALGEATKLVSLIMDDEKVYRYTVTWGESRTTDDSEGDVQEVSDVRPTLEAIMAAIPHFTGVISQVPPRYSAIKVDGERAYNLARAGENVELKARQVEIYSLELVENSTDSATFLCRCGKGTYVRSLARDMAEKLGTKGYISYLSREKVGPFSLNNAISLDFFTKNDDKAGTLNALLPLKTALDDIPVLAVSEAEAGRLKQGQSLPFVSRIDVERLVKAGMPPQAGVTNMGLAMLGELPVAIIEVEKAVARPVRVFNL